MIKIILGKPHGKFLLFQPSVLYWGLYHPKWTNLLLKDARTAIVSSIYVNVASRSSKLEEMAAGHPFLCS